MQSSKSVFTHAAKGIVDELAEELEVSLPRIYEILSKDNPYPKTKRLIRAIAHRDKTSDKSRIRIIKADMDAMFAEILGDLPSGKVPLARKCKELHDVIQAELDGLSAVDRLVECRQAVAVLQQEISDLEQIPIRELAHEAVNGHRSKS